MLNLQLPSQSNSIFDIGIEVQYDYINKINIVFQFIQTGVFTHIEK